MRLPLRLAAPRSAALTSGCASTGSCSAADVGGQVRDHPRRRRAAGAPHLREPRPGICRAARSSAASRRSTRPGARCSEELGRQIEDWVHLGEFYVSTNHHRDNLNLFHGRLSDRRIELDEVELAEAAWFPRDALPPELGVSCARSSRASRAPDRRYPLGRRRRCGVRAGGQGELQRDVLMAAQRGAQRPQDPGRRLDHDHRRPPRGHGRMDPAKGELERPEAASPRRLCLGGDLHPRPGVAGHDHGEPAGPQPPGQRRKRAALLVHGDGGRRLAGEVEGVAGVDGAGPRLAGRWLGRPRTAPHTATYPARRSDRGCSCPRRGTTRSSSAS